MFIRNGATKQVLMSWGTWKSVTVTRRYIATWGDCPWEDTTLPRPTLQDQSPGAWRFESGSRTSRSFWPASVLSRHDTWESDGCDEPNPDAGEASVPEILPVPPPPPPRGPPMQSNRPRPASATRSRNPGGGVKGSIGGGVPPKNLPNHRFSPPSKELRGPGSPSTSQLVIVPQPGDRWRLGLGPSHPKHKKPLRGGVLP